MSTDQDDRVERVKAAAGGIQELYQDVHRVLHAPTRGKQDAETEEMVDRYVTAPAKVDLDQAVAVLKAVIGSQNTDKVRLETLYSTPTGEGGSLGDMIHERLKRLKLGYSELYSYVHATGWG